MISRKGSFIAIILILLAETFALFRTGNAMLVNSIIIGACFCFISPFPMKRWNLVDWVLLIAMAFCFMTCFYSICLSVAYYKTLSLVLLFLAYLLMRKLMASASIAVVFNRLLSFVFICILSFAVISFVYFHFSVIDAGFGETYHFRHLFRPMGYLNNAWAEISLLILGYCCIARKYSAVLLPLATISVLLSFSRGAYLAYVVYFVLYVVFVGTKKEEKRFLILSVAAVLLTACFCHKEMSMTFSVDGDVSKQRSTSYRIDKTNESFDVAASRPLFGYGIGSYTLVTDNVDNETFTDTAPNVLSLLVVEGGLVALFLFLLFCISIFMEMWRHRHNAKVRILGCLFVALLIKEMAQATLLSTPSACWIAITCLAMPFRSKTYETRNSSKLAPRITGLAVSVMCCMLIVFPQYRSSARQIRNMYKKVESLERKTDEGLADSYSENEKLCSAFQLVIKQNPYDKNLNTLFMLYLFYSGNFNAAKDLAQTQVTYGHDNAFSKYVLGWILYLRGDSIGATNHIADAILDNPRLLEVENSSAFFDKSFILSVETKLLNRTASRPQDALESSKYGFILHRLGHERKAKTYLISAVRQLPNLATPWLLLGESKKYLLLTDGAYSMRKDKRHDEVSSCTLLDLFSRRYGAKFQTWYGENLD